MGWVPGWAPVRSAGSEGWAETLASPLLQSSAPHKGYKAETATGSPFPIKGSQGEGTQSGAPLAPPLG